MIDISVNELVKSFEVGQTLLDGLSFDIHEGECVGIMGRNGCGKTTLFRLLTGELSPDSGEIHIAAGKKLASSPRSRSTRRDFPLRTCCARPLLRWPL